MDLVVLSNLFVLGSGSTDSSDAAAVPKVDTPRLSSFLRAACQVRSLMCLSMVISPCVQMTPVNVFGYKYCLCIWILSLNINRLHFKINVD